MASKYWIKLYHEILDDPKMGMLPAELWRFTVELFLLAGEVDCNGTLPNVTKIAWRLRYNVAQVESWLRELAAETGIVTITESGWIVTNFTKRQAAVETSERVKQFRERQKKQKGNEDSNVSDVTPVTEMKRNVTPDTDTDTTTSTGSQNILDEIGSLCSEHFFNPNDEPYKTDLINTIKAYAADKVLWAIKLALSPERANGKPKTWSYVVGILKKEKQRVDNQKSLTSQILNPISSISPRMPPSLKGVDMQRLEQLRQESKGV